jgi:putative DNA primase/helicase
MLGAAIACGLRRDKGHTACMNTIASGMKSGKANPRPLPRNSGDDDAGPSEATTTEGDRPANEVAPSNNLPIIQIKDGELSLLATKAEEVLIAAGVSIYQRSGRLVRPIIETVDATRGRKTKVAQLKVLDETYLRDLLCRHARWEKYNSRSKKMMRINPPIAVAATILARVGDWGFDAISGVITTPTMRPDGSLITEQGYDKATGLLLVEPPPMPPNPISRRERMQRQRWRSRRPTVRISSCRRRGDGVRIIGDDYPGGAWRILGHPATRQPGTRRGIRQIIPNGHRRSHRYRPTDAGDVNWRQQGRDREATGLRPDEGQPLISIDNISCELGGDALCQIIERPMVDIRILGSSESVRIEARGTSLFATGNNFVIIGDVCRRVISAALDPAMERPEFREFKSDPVQKILENRGAYIAAAIIICRAYFVAGQPNKAKRLASFEGWSDTVRSALIWLGKADPVKSMEAAQAENPERIELSELITAWSSTFGLGKDNRLKLSAAVSKGLEMTRPDGLSELEPTYPEFHSFLHAMAQRATGKRGQQPDAAMLGLLLQRRKGQVIDGKRFANLPHKKGAEWWVEVRADPTASVAEPALSNTRF